MGKEIEIEDTDDPDLKYQKKEDGWMDDKRENRRYAAGEWATPTTRSSRWERWKRMWPLAAVKQGGVGLPATGPWRGAG